MALLTRLLKLTWLTKAHPTENPLWGPPLEFHTADGILFRTADGIYFGVAA